MPDFPPIFKDLIARMLQIDPANRITIKQIKEHPAFRFGLPDEYEFPVPLPIPYLPDPVNVEEIDELTLTLLMQIGYSDQQELYSDLTKEGPSMAKVFCNMLTANRSVEDLPWHRDEDTMYVDDGNFLIAPDPLNPQQFYFQLSGVKSLDGFSLVRPVGWANVPTGEYKYDVAQPFIGINLPLEVVLAKIQKMLRAENFEFFHPDDMNIISRRAADMMYLAFKVQRESMDSLQIDLYFKQATQHAIQYLIDALKFVINSD